VDGAAEPKALVARLVRDRGECGSYRCMKLLDNVMEVLERVIEVMIRNSVHIDGKQFGFSPGKGNTDAILIVMKCRRGTFCKRKSCGWHVWISKKLLTEYRVLY